MSALVAGPGSIDARQHVRALRAMSHGSACCPVCEMLDELIAAIERGDVAPIMTEQGAAYRLVPGAPRGGGDA